MRTGISQWYEKISLGKGRHIVTVTYRIHDDSTQHKKYTRKQTYTTRIKQNKLPKYIWVLSRTHEMTEINLIIVHTEIEKMLCVPQIKLTRDKRCQMQILLQTQI